VPVVLAYICCVALAGLIILQAALVAGAPLGRFAWGGDWDVLPARERGFAALAVIGYALAGFVVLQGANVFSLGPVIVAEIATYVGTAVFFASFIITAYSRSASERRIMFPVNLGLAALFLIVAVTGHVKL
jgi:hypothetical protein